MFQPKRPSHRFDAAHAAIRQCGTCATEDPVLEAITRLLLGERDAPSDVVRAYGIYLDAYKREVVEGFLLAGASVEELSDLFGIPPEVARVYAHAFFDLTVFWDRLDLYTYANTYPESHDEGFGRRIKKAALEQGLEYLKATYAPSRHAVSTTTAVRELISQSYVLAKSAPKFALDHDKSKEARQWAMTMFKGIDTLQEAAKADDGGKADLMIQLKVELENADRPALTTELQPEDIVNRRVEVAT